MAQERTFVQRLESTSSLVVPDNQTFLLCVRRRTMFKEINIVAHNGGIRTLSINLRSMLPRFMGTGQQLIMKSREH